LIPAILGTGVGVIAKALLQIATEHIVRADEAERTLAQARMTHTDRPS
jgi:type III secretion system FlhB-like substrate exporter